MIRFSFSSFYMSLIFINIAILFLSLAFCNKKLMLKAGLPILKGVLFLTMLRLLLPVEFLSLSHNIYLPDKLSSKIGDFLHPRFGEHNFSCWSLTIAVWCTGIIIFAVYYLVKEYIIVREIKNNIIKLSDDSLEKRIFGCIKEEFPQTKCIEVYRSSFSPIPMIYGIRHPKILLPRNLNLDLPMLYYVLLHEATHHLHHDQLLKVYIQILCVIYWWNPFCWVMKKQAGTILEMRVDQTVAKSPEEKAMYMDCLLAVVQHAICPDIPDMPISATPFFFKEPTSELKKRFLMLTNTNIKPVQGFLKHVILIFMVALFFLSYTYIFEASSTTEEYSFYSTIPDETNSYFIKRANGKYELYMDGKYCETVDSLEYYDEDIPIQN